VPASSSMTRPSASAAAASGPLSATQNLCHHLSTLARAILKATLPLWRRHRLWCGSTPATAPHSTMCPIPAAEHEQRACTETSQGPRQGSNASDASLTRGGLQDTPNAQRHVHWPAKPAGSHGMSLWHGDGQQPFEPAPAARARRRRAGPRRRPRLGAIASEVTARGRSCTERQSGACSPAGGGGSGSDSGGGEAAADPARNSAEFCSQVRTPARGEQGGCEGGRLVGVRPAGLRSRVRAPAHIARLRGGRGRAA